MPRFLQLLLALAAFLAGLWFLYAGYGRGVSLAGKTSTGFAQLKTGVDGRTRIPQHHLMYAAGFTLLLGSSWWLVKGGGQKKRARRSR
jgi:hypothetical protein